jgi:hypothetical protein
MPEATTLTGASQLGIASTKKLST